MRYWFKKDILTITDAIIKIRVLNNGVLENIETDQCWFPEDIVKRFDSRILCMEIFKDPEFFILPKNKYICVEFKKYKERTNMSDPNPDNHTSKIVWSKTKRYWFFNK